MTNLYLFPNPMFTGIEMFDHYFMPILHSINGILEGIIHLAKYHSQMHGFVDLN
jgi:hypothetical protein